MENVASPTDPFVSLTSSQVVAVSPQLAVVRQPALTELDNHVGVRHASALHAAGYEASRALVAAALERLGGVATMRLAATEIAYTAVGIGPLRTVAEPSDASWDDLLRNEQAELACAVTTRDEEGKTVAELTVTWAVSRDGS